MNAERNGDRSLIRFPVIHRLLHWVIMVGFTALALTGFSLRFGSQAWAQWIVSLLGGAGWTGYWHRFWAMVTYGGVLIHLGWLLYYKTVLRGRFTGPQSIFPGRRDWGELVDHVRYFLGRGRPPRFNRFTYWEKLDYWAMLIGMNTMGLTGLVLWFPVFFSGLVPGYFINLARILHFYEAMLAVALKFVVHLVTAHLRPEVYPLDKSIFNGKTTPERMQREHPGEWEEMRRREDG